MTSQEIRPADWPGFLEQFGLDHRAWRATVERVTGAGRHVEVRDRPLLAVEPTVDRGRTVSIALRFQQDATREPPFVIGSPTRLRVERTGDGAIRSLAIDTADGAETWITFRAAQLPEALDGVAPGEL